MIVTGLGGRIELLDDRLIIHRKGLLAVLSHGLKGDKTIPLSSITAIQFRNAGLFTNGYIQFSIKGGVESRGGMLAATNDENSVLFKRNQRKAFQELKIKIEGKLLALAKHNTPPTSPASTAEEIEKLAALRDKGILSEAEFSHKKRQLLGM